MSLGAHRSVSAVDIVDRRGMAKCGPSFQRSAGRLPDVAYEIAHAHPVNPFTASFEHLIQTDDALGQTPEKAPPVVQQGVSAVTYLMKLDDTRNEDGDDCVVVENGVDMAAVLARASPGRARSFALAMHERACAGHDETALAFWCAVLTSLAPSEDASHATLTAMHRAGVPPHRF